MTWIDSISVLLCLAGGMFFLAGTVGMLRFPGTLARLHALTKADNLGLGFMAVGLALQAGSIPIALKMVFIWIVTILAGTNACYHIGRHVLEDREGAGE